MTAEQSGALTMPALTFRGSSIDNSDPTGFFRRGRPVSARSAAVQLDVRSKPASWGSGPWLPAASLSLNDDSALPSQVRVGEPLTRTIKLRAQGLGSSSAELELGKPPVTEVYADKADTRTAMTESGCTGNARASSRSCRSNRQLSCRRWRSCCEHGTGSAREDGSAGP